MEVVPLGIYISVPFCRTKCSFCNFASGVFSRVVFDRYVEQVCREIASAEELAQRAGGKLERSVDSIYLGGGTPSLLAPDQLERLFAAVRHEFEIEPSAEITVECAPGTLTGPALDGLARGGVNRVSMGVQSFIDKECSSVGRLHTSQVVLADIANLRASGIGNIGIDLIAGLPYQTRESWEHSLSETLATGVPHVSVYMLEVDEDSRLGTELLAGGSRYHAHFVPEEDLTADLYVLACERLEQGGVHQYEISNFARQVTHGIGLHDSRHNLKYWKRQPYLGFGVDAHSMLPATKELEERGVQAVRFATPDSLEAYTGADIARLAGGVSRVDARGALEEAFFLGLRLNRGISTREIAERFGTGKLEACGPAIRELEEAGLLERAEGRLRLTMRGRLLSNEVFGKFLSDDKVPAG